jgi:ribosomal protein S18 acetylase RimI-like enzyme
MDIADWRDILSASCHFWVGPGGRYFAEPGLALTFSGELALDLNVAICHAPGTAAVGRALAGVVDTGSPGLVMLAGPALGAARVLSDAGWIPVSAMPFMVRSISPSDPDGRVRRLGMAGLDELRVLFEKAFGMPPRVAQLALPNVAASDAPDADPDVAVWGLYEGDEMVSGVATVKVGDSICVWSMSTNPARQQRGYGRRLLVGVLAHAANEGARRCLLLATPSGDALYRSMGFTVMEHWQIWSRRRWVLV